MNRTMGIAGSSVPSGGFHKDDRSIMFLDALGADVAGFFVFFFFAHYIYEWVYMRGTYATVRSPSMSYLFRSRFLCSWEAHGHSMSSVRH